MVFLYHIGLVYGSCNDEILCQSKRNVLLITTEIVDGYFALCCDMVLGLGAQHSQAIFVTVTYQASSYVEYVHLLFCLSLRFCSSSSFQRRLSCERSARSLSSSDFGSSTFLCIQVAMMREMMSYCVVLIGTLPLGPACTALPRRLIHMSRTFRSALHGVPTLRLHCRFPNLLRP